MKIVEFASSVDPDEAAHHELPHLDLHYLPSSPWIPIIDWAKHFIEFYDFAEVNFIMFFFFFWGGGGSLS